MSCSALEILQMNQTFSQDSIYKKFFKFVGYALNIANYEFMLSTWI